MSCQCKRTLTTTNSCFNTFTTGAWGRVWCSQHYCSFRGCKLTGRGWVSNGQYTGSV